MKPRITINTNKAGELEIWLNEAGRDLLVRELLRFSEQSDHFHSGRKGSAVKSRCKLVHTRTGIRSWSGARSCIARMNGTRATIHRCWSNRHLPALSPAASRPERLGPGSARSLCERSGRDDGQRVEMSE